MSSSPTKNKPTVEGAEKLRLRNLTYEAGLAVAPAVPASGVTERNTFFRNATVTVTPEVGHEVTIKIDNTELQKIIVATPISLPSGHKITLEYEAGHAPTWTWILQ
jgi:hypothetical protein